MVSFLSLSVAYAYSYFFLIENPCTSDNECIMMNGDCQMHFRGLGQPKVCSCPDSSFFVHDEFYRCEKGSALPALTAYTQPPRFLEEHVLHLTQQPSLPLTWNCTTRSCWGETEALSFFTAHEPTVYAIAMQNPLLSAQHLSWKCRDPLLRPRLVAAVFQGRFEEACLTLDDWCAPHGTAIYETGRCQCESGWFGERCENQVWSPPPSPFVYLTSRPCARCHNETELCDVQTRKCFCRPFHIPVAENECAPVAVYRSDQPRAWEDEYGAIDVYLTPVDPHWVWFKVPLLLMSISLYSDRALVPYDALASLSAYWAREFSFTCLEGAVFLDDQCRLSCPEYCGEGTDCEASATEGYCVCRPGYHGAHCDQCTALHLIPPACDASVPYTDEECRQSKCHGNGDCLRYFNGTEACECDYHFAGSTCELRDSTCGDLMCSGHGICESNSAPACRCFSGWFGANCSQSAAECRTRRCMGLGDCLTPLQGCVCDMGLGHWCNGRLTHPPPEPLVVLEKDEPVYNTYPVTVSGRIPQAVVGFISFVLMVLACAAWSFECAKRAPSAFSREEDEPLPLPRYPRNNTQLRQRYLGDYSSS